MTPDAHSKIVHKIESSNNMKQYAIGCEYIHIVVNAHQLTVSQTAAGCRELRDQCIVACNGNHPWSIKSSSCTVREIEYHDVGRSAMFMDEVSFKHPWEWTSQASITLEVVTEVYIFKVLAESHC